VSGFIESACCLHFEVGCYYREGSSWLGVLLSLPPLFLIDMLHATNGGFDI
jgi:hypothetical protein